MKNNPFIRPRFVILTPNPFPVGNVATNRFSTYAKVLAERGCLVKVIVLKGTENPVAPVNRDASGIYEGVEYEYMAETANWDVNAPYVKKLYLYIAGLLKAVVRLNQNKPDSILIYSNDLFYMIFFWIVTRFLRCSYFIDKSEYPVVKRFKRGLYAYLYIKAFKLFDGILVMTGELYGYYCTIKHRSAKIFLLPMSVDLDRFKLTRSQEENKYIACVFGVHNRDCIADTVKAFENFCLRCPNNNFSLRLAGDYSALRDKSELSRVLKDCTCANRIEFVGVISSNDIPKFLTDANALITTPRSYVSGGFPTKLGEYLATGRVVIATKVGELPNYLCHGKNCLFAAPGNLEEIASAIEYVWYNPKAANKIGAAGRQLANTAFNVRTYYSDLFKFLFD